MADIDVLRHDPVTAIAARDYPAVVNAYEVHHRLSRLEELVEGLYRHLEIPIPQTRDTTMDPVLRLVAAGRKIQAIKVYREITRVGLKEAKEAVEAMERHGPR
ncbi:hypothetical protein GCM10023223_14760 [Stackebrandtia albiflava]